MLWGYTHVSTSVSQESVFEVNLLTIPPYYCLVHSAKQPTNVLVEVLLGEIKAAHATRNVLQLLMHLCSQTAASPG